jgi:flagellar biosynthesis/type III secretory pathway protein FliH
MHDGFEPFEPRRISRAPLPEPSPDEAPESSPAAPRVPAEEQPEAPSAACDRAACASLVRNQAIQLASAACARALHVAFLRNPFFIARFVDDAIRAAGGEANARVRLRPDAAALCASRVKSEIIADDALSLGEVVAETELGTISATIEERAHTLVRSVFDA